MHSSYKSSYGSKEHFHNILRKGGHDSNLASPNNNIVHKQCTFCVKKYTDIILTQNNSYHNKTSIRVNTMWNGYQ